jgi:hypothetical protein
MYSSSDIINITNQENWMGRTLGTYGEDENANKIPS